MILITGCAGFIGSVVTEILHTRGYDIAGIDNFISGKKESLNRNITFYEGDYGDFNLLSKIFSEIDVEIVLHLAGETLVDNSIKEPSRYFHNNLVNGKILLDTMLGHGCNKIIFSSTAAVFGIPVYVPIDEDHPKSPINSYGESKLMFESLLKWYGIAYGLKYNLFRYFNAAGATENNGENRIKETHLLPILFDNITGRIPLIKVFGNNYDTHDGTCIRDYVHVIDVADAHILAINNLEVNPAGQYNLGSNTGYSVLEVIDVVENVTGKKVNWVFDKPREGDPPVLVASNNHAKNELEWDPVNSNLQKITEDTYKWFLKR